MNKISNNTVSWLSAAALALTFAAAGCQKSDRAENVEDRAEVAAEKAVEGADQRAEELRDRADQVEKAGEAKGEQIEAQGEAQADLIDGRADFVKKSSERLAEADRDLAELETELAKVTDPEKKTRASTAVATARELRASVRTTFDGLGAATAATWKQTHESASKALEELEAAIERADDVLD